MGALLQDLQVEQSRKWGLVIFRMPYGRLGTYRIKVTPGITG
jgi:hypothetical protein